MAERLMRFTVLGQEYPLYTDAAEEEVQEILKLVQRHFDGQTKATNQLMSAKIAVLVCLNMAGEYVKLRREFEQYKRQTTSNVDNISNKIEQLLSVE